MSARIFANCLLIGVLFAVQSPVSAQSTGVKITTASATNSSVISSLSQYTQAVNQAGKGRLSLEIAPAPPGKTASDLIHGLMHNELQVIEVPFQSLQLNDPLPAMDSVPFLAMNYPRAQILWRVVRPRLEASLKAHGLRLLYAIPVSALGFISQDPVAHPDDFRDRVILEQSGPVERLIHISGAQGLRVKPDAVASAFKHKGLEFIFISPRQAVADKAWWYARHYTRVTAWFPKHLVLINNSYFNRLDEPARTSLLLTAAASERAAWMATEQRDVQHIQMLRDYGMNIIKPTIPLQLELQKLGRKLLFDWSEGAGGAGALLVEDYYAIR